VILQLFKSILAVIRIKELHNTYGPVWSEHNLGHNSVELKQLPQLPFLDSVIQVFHQQNLFASFTQSPVFLHEIQAQALLLHPLLSLLDNLGLRQGHFRGQVLRQENFSLCDFKFPCHTLKDGVGVEKKRVPVCSIVQFLSHFSLFLFLVGCFLVHIFRVHFLDFLLIISLLARPDNLSDIFQSWFDIDDPAKQHLSIKLTERSHGLLLLFKGHKSIAFGLTIILLGQFDFSYHTKPFEGLSKVILFKDKRQICNVKS
jgi:hypothetical protein